jgi:hypothetical protein
MMRILLFPSRPQVRNPRPGNTVSSSESSIIFGFLRDFAENNIEMM